MSGQPVNDVVGELAPIVANDIAGFEQALGAKFRQSRENESWTYYEFELDEGPFSKGEYRLSNAGDRALLSLTPRDPQSLKEKDLDLTPWGPAQKINVNPRIPPEGTDTLIFEVDGVQLAFQFTHRTRVLRTLAMRWGSQDLLTPGAPPI